MDVRREDRWVSAIKHINTRTNTQIITTKNDQFNARVAMAHAGSAVGIADRGKKKKKKKKKRRSQQPDRRVQADYYAIGEFCRVQGLFVEFKQPVTAAHVHSFTHLPYTTTQKTPIPVGDGGLIAAFKENVYLRSFGDAVGTVEMFLGNVHGLEGET